MKLAERTFQLALDRIHVRNETYIIFNSIASAWELIKLMLLS